MKSLLLLVPFVILDLFTPVTCLICISDSCRSIDGCPVIDDEELRKVHCPQNASCFLRVKIQTENDHRFISQLSQGCATMWQYMKAGNGRFTCFEEQDESITCLCSDSDWCNRRLDSLSAYDHLLTKSFPPSARSINCVQGGALYSGQSYCSYHRVRNGSDFRWHRQTHAIGYLTLLEKSQRDRVCFQNGQQIDCYCKIDRCNDDTIIQLASSSLVGAFDDKATCCEGEAQWEMPFGAKRNSKKQILCFPGQQVCKGDYCFVKFKYNAQRRNIIGRQNCYNVSSELVTDHKFEGLEYGMYREGVSYCRGDFCNELTVVTGSVNVFRWRGIPFWTMLVIACLILET